MIKNRNGACLGWVSCLFLASTSDIMSQHWRMCLIPRPGACADSVANPSHQGVSWARRTRKSSRSRWGRSDRPTPPPWPCPSPVCARPAPTPSPTPTPAARASPPNSPSAPPAPSWPPSAPRRRWAVTRVATPTTTLLATLMATGWWLASGSQAACSVPRRRRCWPRSWQARSRQGDCPSSVCSGTPTWATTRGTPRTQTVRPERAWAWGVGRELPALCTMGRRARISDPPPSIPTTLPRITALTTPLTVRTMAPPTHRGCTTAHRALTTTQATSMPRRHRTEALRRTTDQGSRRIMERECNSPAVSSCPRWLSPCPPPPPPPSPACPWSWTALCRTRVGACTLPAPALEGRITPRAALRSRQPVAAPTARWFLSSRPSWVLRASSSLTSPTPHPWVCLGSLCS